MAENEAVETPETEVEIPVIVEPTYDDTTLRTFYIASAEVMVLIEGRTVRITDTLTFNFPSQNIYQKDIHQLTALGKKYIAATHAVNEGDIVGFNIMFLHQLATNITEKDFYTLGGEYTDISPVLKDASNAN